MPPPAAAPTPAGTFVRVLLTGCFLALALGFPAFAVASALSGGPLGAVAVVKAIMVALLGAAITTWIVRGAVSPLWIAWVGLLGGFVPAALAAPRSRWIGLAVAHLAAGGLLALAGLRLVAVAVDAASDTWSFFGLVTALVGLGLGLGGAVPRLWWAWRGGEVEPADDAVARDLQWLLWLALAALSLASGLAETLPTALHFDGTIALRRGHWEHGCTSTLQAVQDICPEQRRYSLRARGEASMQIEWRFPRDCSVTIAADGASETFAESSSYQVEVGPEREVLVTVAGLSYESCWYQLRARPVAGGAR
ncbi:hypothetical protein OV203_31865 [Nannocystis sp. ILAH1]|uniref:hypothetical protein n=1 Tax=unclassified Nannocystis TaxID=2627009 RepID=UPI00226D7474|nr:MULTISPECIES: hypothetical protein [unclassified Nannocystis]MCY0991779.1 hypothetical protein [Nannocystis sp. ILAH1]MCY1067323.1 hypothetical protein [Nannocystis sp. RBIL2]